MTASVGDAIEVYWPDDNRYYPGKVAAYDRRTGNYFILYDDGEVENINLDYEQWRFLDNLINVASESMNMPFPGAEETQQSCALVSPTSISSNSNNTHPIFSLPGSAKLDGIRDLNLFSTSLSKTTAVRKPSVRSNLFPSKSRQSHRKANAVVSSSRVTKPRRVSLKKSKPSKLANSTMERNEIVFRSSHPHLSAAAGRYIEICVNSWLMCESRRNFGMFSVYQCLSYTLSMLTSLMVDPKYYVKLIRKNGASARWIESGTIGECWRTKYDWRRPHSDAEWKSEKMMLAEVSSLVHESMTPKYSRESCRVYQDSLVEALSCVSFAREKSRRNQCGK